MHSKFKIAQYQHGHAYLTSHRACYVDHGEPRKNSVAIFLKDVDRIDFYVRSTLQGTCVDHATADRLPGWLSKVSCQNHPLSKALEAAIARLFGASKLP